MMSRNYVESPFLPGAGVARGRDAMKLSFLCDDHSNYLKRLWELQIDVSIIYSFHRKKQRKGRKRRRSRQQN